MVNHVIIEERPIIALNSNLVQLWDAETENLCFEDIFLHFPGVYFPILKGVYYERYQIFL